MSENEEIIIPAKARDYNIIVVVIIVARVVFEPSIIYKTWAWNIMYYSLYIYIYVFHTGKRTRNIIYADIIIITWMPVLWNGYGDISTVLGLSRISDYGRPEISAENSFRRYCVCRMSWRRENIFFFFFVHPKRRRREKKK